MKIVNRQMGAIVSIAAGIIIMISENDPIYSLTPREGVAYFFIGIGLFIIMAETAKRFAVVSESEVDNE